MFQSSFRNTMKLSPKHATPQHSRSDDETLHNLTFTMSAVGFLDAD